MDGLADDHAADEPKASDLAFPPLTRKSVDACAFQNWFPKYRRITPKATVLELPDDFAAYLKADGVFLPSSADDEDSECVSIQWNSIVLKVVSTGRTTRRHRPPMA